MSGNIVYLRWILPLLAVSLASLAPSKAGATGTVTVAWDSNSEPGLAGYRVHVGTESGNYTQTIDVGNTTTATIPALTEGITYYSSITAYNTGDLESGYSNEISFVVASPPETTDSDGDGLSNFFETTYGGGQDLDPTSDLDGDGLTAMAEFVHGLDPTKPLAEPVASFAKVQIGQEEYLNVRYVVDPSALNFVDVQTERRTDLTDPNGWHTGQTVQVSSAPSAQNPNLLEIVEQSLNPISAQRMEFIRFRHTVLTP